jgi:hypothetical protein
MGDPQIDNDLIDEAVLALMFLTLHDHGGPASMARAWKSFDWNVMGRLHAKDLILDPVGKAKSVTLTEEGRKRSEAAFYRLFARRDRPQTASDG